LLFNKSLSDGVFPHTWKSSFVLPIFKSNNRASVTNYRPISKLSAVSKLFEKLLEPKLYKLFDGILIDEQHGFRSQKSTSTNLLIYNTEVLNIVGNKGQVDAIYIDLSKAFDSVDHILIKKLSLFGISGQLLS
jgi:hypothetical protein